MSNKQLELFKLGPRDSDQLKVDWSKGGIKKLQIERFKRFENFSIDFDNITLLVGTNSSGKTTVLQAIRLFFWCISTCSRRENDTYVFAKAVIPFSDFHLIPAHTIRELSFHGKSPNSRERAIEVKGILESGLTLSFKIYASYSTLMVIDPIVPSEPLSDEQLSNIKRPPLYIPGFFGVVTRELLAHDARLEELLNSGHHNEVLRNIFLRLKQNDEKFLRLMQIMKDEFQIMNMDLPFSNKETEFLIAQYLEPSNRVPLDFVSAGSGFLQVLQIMVHALQNPSPILLLDEPDAHMHHGLQRAFLQVLKRFVQQENIQVIMASHSETFLRETPLNEIRVIDSTLLAASKFPSEMDLQEELSKGEIWPTHIELAEILRTKRILLLEGETDKQLLNCLGQLKYKDWNSKCKLVQIVFSNGSSDNTTQRLEYIKDILNRIVPEGVKIAHMRDRDLLYDAAIKHISKDSSDKKLDLFILEKRNAESFLIEPRIIIQSMISKFHELPEIFDTPDKIELFVKNEITKWCNEELDKMPGKVKEYNSTWIKRVYPQDQWRSAEIEVDAFLRANWHEPLSKGVIPWLLIDGKSLLKQIRTKLNSYKLHLSNEDIYRVLKETDFDAGLRRTVETIYSWCK
ncbi:MAG TPA: hypothetical protein DDX75_02050 [Phycisphaerales bacterium]|nr:hypothetical protein [Phycisphaerales bacterium]